MISDEIDSKLQGLKILFKSFFENKIIEQSIDSITSFKLGDIGQLDKEDYLNAKKATGGLKLLLDELFEEFDKKFLPYVNTLNEEITKEIKKI